MKKMNAARLKKVRRMVWGLPLVIILPFLVMDFVKGSYRFFPHLEMFHIEPYTDRDEGGISEVELFQFDENRIRFLYTLKSQPGYSIAGLFLSSPYREQLDMSRYDFLKIRLKSTSPRLRAAVKIFIPGFTDKSQATTNLYLESEFDASPEEQTRLIPLKKMKIPEWWYERQEGVEKYENEIDFQRVTGLDIIDSNSASLDRKQVLEIMEIAFTVDVKARTIRYLQFLAPAYLILGAFFFFLKQRSSPVPVRQEIKPGPGKNRENPVIHYILEHYTDPELTVAKIKEVTGVPYPRITRIVRDNCHMPFKQYLNTLRVEEGKRLLKKTDRNITEIALLLGYNNPTHFNRVFKTMENQTPREFRAGSKN